jgi:hypothetical protein
VYYDEHLTAHNTSDSIVQRDQLEMPEATWQ